MNPPPLIVIFGAAVRPDGQASRALLRRIGYGFDAAQAHPESPLLCSGGVGRHGPSEASLMLQVLLERGLPRERLIPDEESLDTLQTVAVAGRLARARGGAPIVAVSDAYHLPRIGLMFRTLGVAARPWRAPPPDSDLGHHVRMALREIPAIPYDVALVAAQRRRLLSNS